MLDERDVLIARRSWIAAYSLFWVVFVFAAVVLSAVVYGQDGAVPVTLVQMSVAPGFMLVYALASIAILGGVDKSWELYGDPVTAAAP